MNAAADQVPAPGGLLLVDKPAGCTSHDVVGRVRRILRTRRVGHAGTLDPMATGLLVIAVERSTKLLSHLVLAGKSYAGTIRLGATTTTDDAQGQVTATFPVAGLTEDAIRQGISRLTGDISQRPSAVSAIKVDGRRAHELVRAGEPVELAARPVRVDRFDVAGPIRFGPQGIELDVEVDCSSGTYIRALARDLGADLGAGGHLTALRRTAVGPFRVEEAVDVYDGRPPAPRGERNPDPSADLVDRVAAAVLAPPQALGRVLPTRTASSAEAHDIAYGRPIPAAGRPGVSALLDPTGARLLALVREQGEVAKPVLVFAPAT